MKFSWTLIIVAIVFYFIGSKYSGIGQSVLGKVGL